MPHSLPNLPAGVELIDSHCHLDEERFAPDREAVIARAITAGVTTMVTVGASNGLDTNFAAVAIAEAHESVFATVGIHPHDARIVDDQIIDELRRLASHPKVVAIGETGLDYYYEHSSREQQREAFRRFLCMAREFRLPCVVHLRDAYEDAIAIMKEERATEIGGVIHCFSGDRANARDFLDLGFDLSFSGIVSFKNADELRAAAAMVPADRFMVETDAPFLAPVPFRGKRNEPAFALFTAATIAAVRGEALATIVRDASATARRRFCLERN